MPLKLEKTNLSGLRTFEGLGLNQGASETKKQNTSALHLKFFCITNGSLKGPKHEKFVAGIFTQIRPVWIGEFKTRQKTPKNEWLGSSYIFLLAKFFSDVSDSVSVRLPLQSATPPH